MIAKIQLINNYKTLNFTLQCADEVEIINL